MSTAIRLCDGCLIVVDVVEGLCPQTVTVLRQAWIDGVRPCLVLNKMDRLIVELQLTPDEAHHRLKTIVESVNALVSTFHRSEFMANLDRELERRVQEGIALEGEAGIGT